jgi:hypothetical protein
MKRQSRQSEKEFLKDRQGEGLVITDMFTGCMSMEAVESFRI